LEDSCYRLVMGVVAMLYAYVFPYLVPTVPLP